MGSREPGLLLNGCVPQAQASAALNLSFLIRWMNEGFGRTASKDKRGCYRRVLRRKGGHPRQTKMRVSEDTHGKPDTCPLLVPFFVKPVKLQISRCLTSWSLVRGRDRGIGKISSRKNKTNTCVDSTNFNRSHIIVFEVSYYMKILPFIYAFYSIWTFELFPVSCCLGHSYA